MARPASHVPFLLRPLLLTVIPFPPAASASHFHVRHASVCSTLCGPCETQETSDSDEDELLSGDNAIEDSGKDDGSETSSDSSIGHESQESDDGDDDDDEAEDVEANDD